MMVDHLPADQEHVWSATRPTPRFSDRRGQFRVDLTRKRDLIRRSGRDGPLMSTHEGDS